MKRTPTAFTPRLPLPGRIAPAVPVFVPIFLSLLLIAACDSRQPTEPAPPSAPPQSATPGAPATPTPSVSPTPSSDAPPMAVPEAAEASPAHDKASPENNESTPPVHPEAHPRAPAPEAHGSGKPATGQHAEPPPGKSSRLQIPQTLPDRAERRCCPSRRDIAGKGPGDRRAAGYIG